MDHCTKLNQDFKCITCGYGTWSVHRISTHYNRKHPDLRKLCWICFNCFASEKDLELHKKRGCMGIPSDIGSGSGSGIKARQQQMKAETDESDICFNKFLTFEELERNNKVCVMSIGSGSAELKNKECDVGIGSGSAELKNKECNVGIGSGPKSVNQAPELISAIQPPEIMQISGEGSESQNGSCDENKLYSFTSPSFPAPHWTPPFLSSSFPWTRPAMGPPKWNREK